MRSTLSIIFLLLTLQIHGQQQEFRSMESYFNELDVLLTKELLEQKVLIDSVTVVYE